MQQISRSRRVPNAAPPPKANDPAAKFTLYLAGAIGSPALPASLEGETLVLDRALPRAKWT
jgi:hypothetical protein